MQKTEWKSVTEIEYILTGCPKTIIYMKNKFN
jgi:hypothetical protein